MRAYWVTLPAARWAMSNAALLAMLVAAVTAAVATAAANFLRQYVVRRSPVVRVAAATEALC